MSSPIETLSVAIGIDAGSLEEEAKNAASAFETSMKRITLAGAAVGAGLEAFARGQADSNAKTRILAAGLGISEDAMRDLASETANVGFPLDEVLDLMELGKQQGLKSADALKEYANFWDMVGDATGESAVDLGKAGTALHTMGIGIGHESDALSALGFISEHTTSTQADFLALLGRIGPDLKDTGLSIDDTAALLGELEQEFGLTGRAARTELTKALKESDGSFSELLDNLGISETKFEGYADAVENSSGVLQRNSDIVDKGFTPLQKLQNEAKELMFNYGDLANVAGMLAPLLMALGPAIKGVSVAIDIGTKAVKGISSAMAFLAANPIVIVIALIVAAVAALIYFYNTSETFRNIVNGVFKAVGGAAMWLWNNAIKPAFKAIGAIATWLWQHVISPYFTAIGKIIVWVVNRVRLSVATWRAIFIAIGALVRDFWQNKIVKPFNAIVSFVRSIPGKFRSGMSRLAGVITAPFRAGFNAVARLWNNTVGQLHFSIPSWVPGIGGKGWSAPTLPTFHGGGIVPGPRGAEVLGVLQGGERVLPLGSEGAGGGELVLRSDGTKWADAVVASVAEAVRRKGPRAIGLRVAT